MDEDFLTPLSQTHVREGWEVSQLATGTTTQLQNSRGVLLQQCVCARQLCQETQGTERLRLVLAQGSTYYAPLQPIITRPFLQMTTFNTKHIQMPSEVEED